jgi:hypothetical protein
MELEARGKVRVRGLCSTLLYVRDLSRARVSSDCSAGWLRFGRARTPATWPVACCSFNWNTSSRISDTRVVSTSTHFTSQLDQVGMPVYRALCVGARRSARGGGGALFLCCATLLTLGESESLGGRKVLGLSARSLAHTTYARSLATWSSKSATEPTVPWFCPMEPSAV